MTDFELVLNAGMNKINMYKNDKRRFFMRSVGAGLYLGLATILSYTLTLVFLESNPALGKTLYAAMFGTGLVLIVLLGAELFTGNCFTTMIPVFAKKAKLTDLIGPWVMCYVGNFVGIGLVCALFAFSGSNHQALNDYMLTVMNNKFNFDILQLIIKGILCNFIVCAAAYAGMKLKDEMAKTFIMMIVVMAFVLPGFEHSIANMGTFTLGACCLGGSISYSLLPLHMVLSTLGNIIGGSLLFAIPVYEIIKPRAE